MADTVLKMSAAVTLVSTRARAVTGTEINRHPRSFRLDFVPSGGERMSRIFLSHSSKQNVQAIAFKKWLEGENAQFASDVFLDIDPVTGLRPGEDWQDALDRAGDLCRSVIYLWSDDWENSEECKREFRYARRKTAIPARLEEGESAVLGNKHRVDLFGDIGPQATIEVEYGGQQHTVCFPLEGLHKLRDAILGDVIGAKTFRWPPDGDPERAPYRGRDALEEKDAAVFFGRDAELVAGLDAMHEMATSGQSLLVIVGDSGVGKSSFIRAGLLPRLDRDDRRYLVLDPVRLDHDVITGGYGLAKSIWKAADKLEVKDITFATVSEACRHDSKRLAEILSVIRDAAAGRRLNHVDDDPKLTLVLPIDQAERLFTMNADAERRRFDEASRLLELLGEEARRQNTERVPLIAVVGLRSAYHEHLQRAPQLDGVSPRMFNLRSSPVEQFKEVITGPAARATSEGNPLEIDPALVSRLLEDFRAGANTLPLLSVVLESLYTAHGVDGHLTLDDYHDGPSGADDVVPATLTEALARYEPTRGEELDALREAFVPWLATFDPETGTPVCQPGRWTDLPARAKPLLDRFVDKRLLTDGGDTVELALDSILRQWPDLRGWLEADRDELVAAESLIRDFRDWESNRRRDGWLLGNQRIEEADGLQARFGKYLLPTREFVEQSRRRVRDQRRRRRAVLAVTAVTALVAVVAGLGLWNSQRTRTGMQFVTEAEQRLDGGRKGGDVLALQQLLAARDLGALNADAVVGKRRDLLKIMENPVGAPGQAPAAVKAVAVRPSTNGTDPGSSERVVAASDDRSVRVWDTATGRQLRQLPIDEPVSSAAYNPDGTWIATGSADGTLRLWDAETGEPIGAPIEQGAMVTSISFSSDGKLVATGGGDGVLRVWDTERSIWTLREHIVQRGPGAVRVVAFQPPLKLPAGSHFSMSGPTDVLVSGNDDSELQLWNGRTGRALGPPVVIGTTPTSVAFGVTVIDERTALQRVAVGTIDGTIQLFDATNLSAMSAVVPAHPGSVNSVAFSSAGTRIVSGGTDNTVRVWRAEATPHTVIEPIGGPLIGHHGSVESVAFNEGTTRIVSGSRDGSIRVWDAVTGVPIPTGQGAEVRAVAFNPTSDLVAAGDKAQMASGGTDGTVKLWNPLWAAPIGQLGEPIVDDKNHTINRLAYSPDGARIVTGGADGVIRLWDLSVLSPQRRSAGFDSAVQQVVTRADHSGTTTKIMAIAFSPDGTKIVSGDSDGGVRLWDGYTLSPLGQPQQLPYQVWSAVFTDNDHLVTGSGLIGDKPPPIPGRAVQYWAVNPLAPAEAPLEGPASVYTLAFTPKPGLLAAGGGDGIIRVWPRQSGWAEPTDLSSDQNTVGSLAFANKHPWIVSGGADGKVRLWKWDQDHSEPMGSPIDAQQTWVYEVAFSPDDRLMVSAGGDGTLHLWPAPTDNLEDAVCPKLNANMSRQQWKEVAPWWLSYSPGCADLPIPDDLVTAHK